MRRHLHSLKILKFALTLILSIATFGCGGTAIQNISSPPSVPLFSVASLNGSYAFSADFMAGSFRTDGKGTITTGVEDTFSTPSVGPPVHQIVSFTGNYTVGNDGRGTLTLVSAAAGSLTLPFVLLNSQHGLILNFMDPTFGSVSGGKIDQQDPTAFSLTTLANNSYAFLLHNVAGTFTANASGVITSGTEDSFDTVGNDQSLPLSGTMGAVDGNGRGVATLITSLGTVSVAFYVIDSSHIHFLETDTNFRSGDAFSRQGPFDNNSLAGSWVVSLFSGTSILAAVFTADNTGNVTSGTEDRFAARLAITPLVLYQGPFNLTGTYSMTATGRGTISITDSSGQFHDSIVVFPSSAGLVLLEFGRGGVALKKQPATFSNTSLAGSFGLVLSGASVVQDSGGQALGSVGMVTADSNGNLTGGQATTAAPGTLFASEAFTGTYSITANGRGTATLATGNPHQVVVYIVSPSSIVIVGDTASAQIYAGSLVQQH